MLGELVSILFYSVEVCPSAGSIDELGGRDKCTQREVEAPTSHAAPFLQENKGCEGGTCS